MKPLTAFFALACAFSLLTPGGVWGQQGAANSSSSGISSSEKNATDGSLRSLAFFPSAHVGMKELGWVFNTYYSAGNKEVVFVMTGSTQTKQGTRVDRFAEYYKGIRVELASCAVVSRNNEIQFITSNVYVPNSAGAAVASITEASALDMALAHTGAQRYMWEDSAMQGVLRRETNRWDTSYFPKGKLVWMEDVAGGRGDRVLHLAYAFNVYALVPLSRELVYVDATTGAILFANPLLASTVCTGNSLYSGNVSFQAVHIGGTYSLHDSTRGGGINTYNCANGSGSVFYEDTSHTAAWATDASLDAHWGAEKVFDYWLTVQGRNSINNAGMAINSYTHLLTGYNNAYWDGSHMSYGDGTGIATGGFSSLVALDVCAHEIGHGICQYTAGLVYNKESGAMNEGFSDIWAAVIENYADPHEADAVAKNMWAIGEEISASGLRRMDSPGVKHNPATYGGTFWVGITGCVPNVTNDYCGVHTNSGVLNHWFYLLAHGGAGTNDIGSAYAVTGIGIADAANLAYQTELVLTSDATYADCRTASINVATTLFGTCSPEVEAVTRAWYAVGVGADFAFTLSPITGPSQVCVGSSIALSNAGTGGTWTSGSASVASVGGVTGVATGVAAGTTIITYTVGSGCFATYGVTVNALPSAITGAMALCSSASGSLASAPAGGTWTSSNAAVAAVNPVSGLLTGVASGSATISYTLGTGCFVTRVATINAVVSITGPSATCPLGSIVLSDATAGGTWASSTPATATINPATGALLGVAAGTTTVSYSVTGGCGAAITTRVITVNPVPNAGTITGPLTVCAGFTVTLSDPVAGGVWSSVDSSRASVSSSGVVTGFAPGADTIKYTFTNSCGTNVASKVVTVNASLTADIVTTVAGNGIPAYSGDGGAATAAAIYRPEGIAFDASGNLYFADVSNATVRKVSLAGVITTIAGIGTKGYGGDGAPAVMAQFSDPFGIAIDSTGNIYISDPVNFRIRKINTLGIITTVAGTGTSGIAPDGSPASSGQISQVTGMITDRYGNLFYCEQNNTVREIDTNGIVRTVAGTGTFGYSGDGGPATLANIAAANDICFDASGNLYIADAGNNTIRKVDASGIITTVAGIGSTGFSGDGGPATNAKLNTPTGVTIDGAGNMYIVDDFNYRIRKVSSSGIITTLAGIGVAAYNGNNMPVLSCAFQYPHKIRLGPGGHIFLSDAGNDRIRKIIPPPPLPSIGGVLTVCAGSTSLMTYPIAGGTWSSSNPLVATINPATGSAMGISNGTSVITYAISNACGVVQATTILTVDPSAIAITGPPSVCVGQHVTLTGGAYGWTSSSPSIASVDVFGAVTALVPGTTTITHVTSACSATIVLTVNPDPAPIAGLPIVCSGSDITLSDVISGGTWTCSDPGIAFVDAGGVLTGVVPGTTIVSYTLPTGCGAARLIIVRPIPAPIAGPLVTCAGGSIPLSNGVAGGSWNSSAPAIATVNSLGTVHCLAVGTAIITYTLPTGCSSTAIVTVNASSVSISGPSSVCPGQSTVLSNSNPASWSSSNPSKASIDISGTVYGIAAGTCIITCTLLSGCFGTTTLTVNPLPSPIGGSLSVCYLGSGVLSNGTPGGTWSSATPSVASINVSGAVNGLAVGTPVITYTLPTGCFSTAVFMVNPPPAVITGPGNVCMGQTIALSDVTPGGTWSSSNTATGTVSSSGEVAGISSGGVNISYVLSTGCYVFKTIAVSTSPPLIAGTAAVCPGQSSALSNAMPGGLWTSSNTAVASIDPGGSVSGVVAGNAVISYTLPATGCYRTATFTVNPLPPAIGGPTDICTGSSVALYDGSVGGTWSSSNTNATIGISSGVVTGMALGAAFITYRLPTGCSTVQPVIIGAPIAPITGPSLVCILDNITLADGTPGGTWSSSGPNAVIDAATGAVTAMSVGYAPITYKVSAGCVVTKNLTVNPAPPSIAGSPAACLGSTTLLVSSGSGTWSTSSANITVGSSTGIVTGVTAGSGTVTYTFAATGCHTLRIVTVAPLPGAINGADSLCAGSVVTLSDTAAGGTWSTYSGAVLLSTGGVITGITAGTAKITYTLPTGCAVNKTITVNALPNVFAVTGGGSYCSSVAGLHISLGGSQAGVSYQLYNGSSAAGAGITGGGAAIDFGSSSAGSYSVRATNTTTGCVSGMTGIAAVTEIPAVIPGITTSTSTGNDTSCAGDTLTFAGVAVNEGAAPHYQWFVNGAAVAGSVGTGYSYIPANGDVVKLRLNSSAVCALPDSAVSVHTISVLPYVVPHVAVSANPGSNVCAGTAVTFTATPTNGGAAPAYIWMLNGSIAGGSTSYTYTAANGDSINCVLLSNMVCRLADSARGTAITMVVTAPVTPVVSVSAIPGTSITSGQGVVFTANITSGIAPVSYQWSINHAVVPGATLSTFSGSAFVTGDSVSCVVTNGDICSSSGRGYVTMRVSTGAALVKTLADIYILPNPSTGWLNIKGSLGTMANEDVYLKITDMLGQVVEQTTITARNGIIDEHIELNNTLANGMYLLTVQCAAGSRTFHFVLGK